MMHLNILSRTEGIIPAIESLPMPVACRNENLRLQWVRIKVMVSKCYQVVVTEKTLLQVARYRGVKLNETGLIKNFNS